MLVMGGAVCGVLPPRAAYAQAVDTSGTIEYLEFREVDIKDVLRQIAKQYNLNIVFSESVRGLITVQLHDVNMDEALDAIIAINGFVYIKKGKIYKVTTPEEAEREGRQTKVFRLSNANAAQLKITLKEVLSSDGTIEADERSNSIIVTDTSGVISKIDNLISGLDEVTPQVLIEAKFIETSFGMTEKLGIDWSVTAQAQGAKRPVTMPFNAKEEEDFLKILPAATGFPAPYGFPYTVGDDFTFGTLDFSAFKAVLNFLETKTDSKLISSPRVVTTNNKEAKITIGKARPIPEFEYNSESQAYQITDFKEKNEGVTLTVTPHVSNLRDGTYSIKLQLEPKVSNYTNESVTFVSLGFEYPLLAERSANTEVIIKDGQTIVIGGLIETKSTETIKKVPFFGDIPLVGLLFTHKSVDPDTRTELLIFVTARVLKQNAGSLLAYESRMTLSPARPLKLDIRKVEVK